MIEKLIEIIIGRVLTKNQKSACIAFFFSLLFFVPVLPVSGVIRLPDRVVTYLAIGGGILLLSGIVLLFVKDTKD